MSSSGSWRVRTSLTSASGAFSTPERMPASKALPSSSSSSTLSESAEGLSRSCWMSPDCPAESGPVSLRFFHLGFAIASPLTFDVAPRGTATEKLLPPGLCARGTGSAAILSCLSGLAYPALLIWPCLFGPAYPASWPGDVLDCTRQALPRRTSVAESLSP